MEIQINVLNEMKKLRTSTYSDKYTWVDELVQNAQRAGASNIHVETDDYNETITIEDNGCGCTDPQILFSKSDTGWSQDVVDNESPFGEGFFSTMMAANLITVSSVGFDAVFDVKKMFETGDIDCIEVTPNTRKSGFKVVLSDLTDSCRMWGVRDRFRSTCRYIKKPMTILNGEKIPYEGTTPKDKGKYFVKLDNELFTGWLMPHSWRNGQYDNNYLKVFAYERLVRDFNDLHHDIVNGVIHLKDNAVVLRSPDRKDIIQDEKYDRFVELIEEGIHDVMAKILRYGDDTIIKNFESAITKYVPSDECRKYIKFKFIDDKAKPSDFVDADSFDTDDNGIAVSSPAPAASVQSDYDDSYDPSMSGPTMNYIEDAPTQIGDDVFMETVSEHVATPVAARRKPVRNMPKSEQTGQSLDGVKYAFYVKENDVSYLETSIELAKQNKIPVIVVRNDIELKCLENDSDNIKPLDDIDSYISIYGTFDKAYPRDAFEQRIYNLLNEISKKLCGVPDLFIIADTKMHKILTINSDTYQIEEIQSATKEYKGKIYINRKFIKTYGVSLDNNQPFLNDMDKRFVMLNVETIASELATVMYHTHEDTREHYMKMLDIIHQIVYMLFEY